MWGGRQWTFQVLLQGYVHSPTYCHNLVACDLAEWKNLDNIKLYHYIDNLILSSDSLALKRAVNSLAAHLQDKGWAINPQKVQGPGLSVKFLGVVWPGKTNILPCAVKLSTGIPSPYHAKAAARILGYTGIMAFLYIPPSAAADTFVLTPEEMPKIGLGENGMRLSSKENCLLNSPRHWVYSIPLFQLN